MFAADEFLIYHFFRFIMVLRDLKEWLTGTRPRLPFTRRQIFAAVKPKHGRWAALHYYESLLRSFLTHDDSTCLFSSQPWVSRGHRDAAILRADPTQLQSILHRLSKAP